MDDGNDIAGGMPSSEIDSLVADTTSASEASDQLRAAFDREPDPQRKECIRAIGTAMLYRLVSPRDADASLTTGPWGPLLRYTDGTQVPPPPDEIDLDTAAIWERASSACSNPLLVARTADLCWTLKRKPRPDRHARRAIEAYLRLAATPRAAFGTLRQADDAQRALQLSRELGDQELTIQAETALLDIAERGLGEEAPGPGAVLGALQPLIDRCSPTLRGRVLDLVQRCVTAFADDPWAFESAADLLGRLVPADDQAALRERVVDNWLAVADAASGLVGFAHRQRALELAKTFGMSERADAIRVRLQSEDPKSLGMQRIRYEGRAEGVDEMIGALVSGSFVETLLNLVAFGPPSGDPARNREQVEAQRQAAPLQAALPRTLVGLANSTIWNAPPDTPERERYDLADTERFRIGYTMSIFGIALEEARRRYGDPTHEDLVSAFTTDVIRPVVASRLADGVLSVLSDDFDTGVNVALPRIEATVREMVRQCGRPITVEPRGATPGGVRVLGGLLDELRGVLDEGWRRYLVNALVEPLGLNLRNRALHGLVDSSSREEGLVVMHVIAFLATLRTDRTDATE